MNDPTGIGQIILEEIIKQGMIKLSYPEVNDPCVFVWNANSEEQLEAIVDRNIFEWRHLAINRQNEINELQSKNTELLNRISDLQTKINRQ
jgi:hypothetical protein